LALVIAALSHVSRTRKVMKQSHGFQKGLAELVMDDEVGLQMLLLVF